MTDSVQINVERSKEGTVMYLRGRIDIESSPCLRDKLLSLLRQEPPSGTIAVDLMAVPYMDTSGIATLVEGLKIARIGNIQLYIQGLEGRLLHLFQSTGIGSLFGISGSTNPPSATWVS